MSSSPSSDQLHRFVLEPANIRGEIITLSKTFLDATEHQNLPDKLKVLLGEFLAAVGLLRDTLKVDGTLTLQARGAGPIPMIMAEGTADGTLRGIVKQTEDAASDINQLNSLPELIGEGVLSLTLDPKSGNRYQGIVGLEGNTLAEALTAYFNQSEQLPSQVWLCVNEHSAAGLMLQALPEQSDDKESSSEEHWNTATALAETLTTEEITELDHNSMLMRLFNEFEIRVFPPSEYRFGCRCSRERSAQALISIGRTEAQTLLSERDIIELNCEFCGAHYTFSSVDLDELFGGPQNLH